MSVGKRLLNDLLPLKAPSVSPFGKVNFNLFFDRQGVRRRLDRKERKVLSGTGSWARGFQRRSIRKGYANPDRRSTPGDPPRYYTRGFASLKDGIFFQADLDRSSVVIGPNKLRTGVRPHNKASGAQLLEEGGRATVSIHKDFRGQMAMRKRVVGRYRARPFVGPSKGPAGKRMLELMKQVDL